MKGKIILIVVLAVSSILFDGALGEESSTENVTVFDDESSTSTSSPLIKRGRSLPVEENSIKSEGKRNPKFGFNIPLPNIPGMDGITNSTPNPNTESQVFGGGFGEGTATLGTTALLVCCCEKFMTTFSNCKFTSFVSLVSEFQLLCTFLDQRRSIEWANGIKGSYFATTIFGCIDTLPFCRSWIFYVQHNQLSETGWGFSWRGTRWTKLWTRIWRPATLQSIYKVRLKHFSFMSCKYDTF